MKNRFACILTVLILLLQTRLHSQTITIDNANFSTGPYGAGGSITVPIKLTGDFTVNDQFLLFLSDANGNFPGGGKLIGGYNSFFTPFVNGTLPGGISGTKYKLRVVLDSAKSKIADTTAAITIQGAGDTVANIIPAFTPNTDVINDTTFGLCQAKNFSLNLKSTTGQVLDPSSIILDSSGGVKPNSNSSPNILFNAVQGNYYTIQAKVKNPDNTLSIRSFLVLNTYVNNNFGQGPTSLCIPKELATASLAIATYNNHGVLNNYPGTFYSIDWGDTTNTVYTLAQLIDKGGQFFKKYKHSSCGQPEIDLGPGHTVYNAYKGVNIDSNRYCPGQFSNNLVYYNVSQSPTAIIDSILPFCGNGATLTICGTSSDPGIAALPDVNSCNPPVLTYTWFLNGNQVNISPDSSCFTVAYNKLKNGNNTVTLVVDNGLCNDSTTRIFCFSNVKPAPDFKFTVGGVDVDSVSSCAPYVVKTHNLSDKNDACNTPLVYHWYVTDSVGNLLTVGVDYSAPPLNKIDSVTNPIFNFTKPGKYYIHLAFQDACSFSGVDSTVKIVDIIGTGDVTLPGTKKYCGLKTIDFATDTNHIPRYNSQQGTEHYYWTITGGVYKYVGGTNANSRYPQIEFDEYKQYIVKDSFVNSCGNKTAQQTILFSQGATVLATQGAHDTAVCFSADTLQLNGSVIGSTDSIKWFTSGAGTFKKNKTLTPVYTFAAADKDSGFVYLTLSAYLNPASGCPIVSDTLHVIIKPHNYGTDSSVTICSGDAVSYQPVSSIIPGSTYSWTSSVSSPSVTGNTTPGNNIINDVLHNSSNSTNGTVTYTITPAAQNCAGDPYKFIVHVNAMPALKINVPKDTVCSGTNINIRITSVLKGIGTSYASQFSDSVNGTTNQPAIIHQDTVYITDAPVNTSTSNRVVSYIIQPYGTLPGECLGTPDTVKIVVLPGASPAYAGNDTALCNQASVNLYAVTPAVGTGTWTQFTNEAINIVQTHNPNTLVTGLQPNKKYIFVWQIGGGNAACGSSADSVIIYNRPPVTLANAGRDSIFCGYAPGSTVTVNIKGNSDNTRPFETGVWSIITQPAGSTPAIGDVTKANTTFSFSTEGVYQLQWMISNDAGCQPSLDTITFKAYAAPSAAKPVATDTNICAGQDVTVIIPQYTGVLQKWQFKSPYATGVWKDTSVTNSSISFNNITDSFWVRAVIISAGVADGCAQTVISDSVKINTAPPTQAGNASPDTTVCGGANSGVITLNGYVGNITKWQYSQDNGASWNDITNTTDKQPFSNLTVTTWYRAVVASGTCSGSFSSIAIVTVSGFATKAAAGMDDSLCGTTVAILTGNNPAAGETGAWKLLTGQTITTTPPNIPSLTVSGLQPGVYFFEWSITNNFCPATKDTAAIVIYPAITDTITDTSVTVCKSIPVTIPGYIGKGGNGNYAYQWQQSTDGGQTWNAIAGQTSQTLSFIPDATMLVRRVIVSGPCTVNSNIDSIFVQPPIGNNTINASQAICINTAPAIITGQVPTGAGGNYQYTWQQSTDGINWNDTANVTGKDFQPPVLTVTTYYRRIVSTNLCSGLLASISDTITITVHQNAKATFNFTKDTGCIPFAINANNITVTDYPDRNGTYQWFANGVQFGQGLVFPGYTMTKDNDSAHITLKAVSQYGCLPDTMGHTFYTLQIPAPTFTIDDSLDCGPLTVTFTNTTLDKQKFTYWWNFGNGQTTTLADPPQVTYQPSPSDTDIVYTATLYAINACDSIAFKKNILVQSKPMASFTPDSSFNCSPRNVVFTNNSEGNRVTYIWDFGDGSPLDTNNSHTVTHTFYTGVITVFKVALVAINNCGRDTAYFSVGVNPASINLHFGIDLNQKFNCAGQPVTFKNNTTGANIFNWDFGDPQSGNNNNLTTVDGLGTVTHVYKNPGTYIIKLCAESGCTKDTCTTQTVEIKQTPKAAMGYPAVLCAGDVAGFTNKSQPADSVEFTWYYGDGGVETTSINPTHVYANAGVDSVLLVAKAVFPLGLGCSDTTSGIITVNGPTGQLSYSAKATCLHDSITFQAVSSNTTTYQFYFGDGDNSGILTNPVATHAYKLPGLYVPYVVLTTRNCSKQIQGIDTIHIDGVKASFNYTATPYCDSSVVQFTDNSLATFGIKKWDWLFGDGRAATGQNQTHTYYASATYPVKLTVESNNGCIDTVSINIALHVKTKPAFSIESSTTGCIGQAVNYRAVGASADTVSLYNWAFSNGLSLNGIQVTNYYAAGGNYTATLVTGTINGCYDTAVSVITINPSPTVTAGNDQQICKGSTIQLNATGNVTPLNWNPVDGSLSCTQCTTTLAAPQKTTQYTVSGTNQFGCTSSDTVLVMVIQPIHVTVTGDTLLCLGDSTRLFAHGADEYVWSPSTGITDGVTNQPSAIFQPTITTQYRVAGNDSSHCFYDTSYVTIYVGNYPTISLEQAQTLSTGTLFTLVPSYNNGPHPVKWLWQPSTNLDCDTCEKPVTTVMKNICYTVKGTTAEGCSAQSDSLCIAVFCDQGQVFIPNAFTPDGDGKNDVLMVRATGVKTVKKFVLFNRWGQVVFERSNFAPNDKQNGWDGRINGKFSEPEVFVYVCQVECDNGTILNYSGNTAVLKRAK